MNRTKSDSKKPATNSNTPITCLRANQRALIRISLSDELASSLYPQQSKRAAFLGTQIVPNRAYLRREISWRCRHKGGRRSRGASLDHGTTESTVGSRMNRLPCFTRLPSKATRPTEAQVHELSREFGTATAMIATRILHQAGETPGCRLMFAVADRVSAKLLGYTTPDPFVLASRRQHFSQ